MTQKHVTNSWLKSIMIPMGVIGLTLSLGGFYANEIIDNFAKHNYQYLNMIGFLGLAISVAAGLLAAIERCFSIQIPPRNS